MIIRGEGATTENVAEARRSLQAIAHDWGQDIAEAPAAAATPPRTRDDHGLARSFTVLAILVVHVIAGRGHRGSTQCRAKWC
jgi:hypothetical protein